MTYPIQARPRRSWRLVGLIIALVVALPLCAVGGIGVMAYRAYQMSMTDTVGEIDFTNRLAVPPLAPSRVDDQGRRVFDLRAKQGSSTILPGPATRTWGVNGAQLGPTLRAKRGEKVLVNVTNGLNEATTLHWHGMHLPAAMDGGPHQMVQPGETWSPTWKVDQPATSLWYHPHLHGRTAAHVYRGLAGMFLLDDKNSKQLELPSRYGVDDIPMIVQDRRMTEGNQFDESPGDWQNTSTGLLGDTILVNGTYAPYQKVTTERVRLRLLNGSNGRVYHFGLAGNEPFALIGTDGGLLPAPHQSTRIQLSPGERAEIVVEMRPGERTELRSYPPDLGVDFFTRRFDGGDDSFDVVQLRAADKLKLSPELPTRLAPAPALDPSEVVKTRDFRLSGHSINGKQMEMDRVDEVVGVDTTEIWRVHNNGGQPHSFHVHDVQFQILDIDGSPPPADLRGWKDTIYAYPDRTFRLIMRFSDYRDPTRPYMYHCHVLMHEDRGMMGQFVVVGPGERPRLTGGHGAGDHGDSPTSHGRGHSSHGGGPG
ncbi:MAG: multicopper oxidase family protein [Micromonosporaceae bacterium]